MKKITLQELGAQLPIPVNEKRQTFAFKAWRMPEEKAMSKIRETSKTFGKAVRESFDFMLSQFDGGDWKAIDANERKLLLNRMPFANMMYMWLYLRFDALGEKIVMQDMTCPHCEGQIKKFEADLGTMEVECKGFNDEMKEIKVEPKAIYNLKKPVMVGEVMVTKIFFGFTPWDSMEKLGNNEKNQGAVKEQMIKSSYLAAGIEGSDKEQSLLKENVLDALTKKDIEGLYSAIDEHNGGPVLGMTYDCPHCAKEVKQSLNWTYDYFFGNLSL